MGGNAVEDEEESGANQTNLHIDNPFWVVLKEYGKHPYFIAEINEPEDQPFTINH